MCRELFKKYALFYMQKHPFLCAIALSGYIHQDSYIVCSCREDYKDLEGAGAVPCDITVLSVGVFQALLSKVLRAYLTTVFTCMPKISQAHNHWV